MNPDPRAMRDNKNPAKVFLLATALLVFAFAAGLVIYFNVIGTPENRLIYAAETGDIATTKSLLSHSVSVDALDSDVRETALMAAVEHHHADVAQLLLDRGANANLKDSKGNTALIQAAMDGDTILVMALLSRGANVNAQNDYAETPLSDAVINGHSDVVKLLLDHGANANWKYIANPEADGKTLLEEAKNQNSYDIVALLRKAGAK